MGRFGRRCVCFLQKLGTGSQDLHVRMCEKKRRNMESKLPVQRSESKRVLLGKGIFVRSFDVILWLLPLHFIHSDALFFLGQYFETVV